MNKKHFLLFLILLIPRVILTKKVKIDPIAEPTLDPIDTSIFQKRNIVHKPLPEPTKQEESKEQKNEAVKKETPKPKIQAQLESESELRMLELNFENAALKNILDYISEAFDVTFLPDDAISLEDKKLKGVNDVKVTFKSNRLLPEKDVWMFLDFILNSAGLARIPMPNSKNNFFRITTLVNANKSSLPTYININSDDLPDTGVVRYIYFANTRQVSQLRDVLIKLQSKTASIEIFQDLNALIFTDDAYNIKSLMKIVKSLDNRELPEVLSVIRLKNADATDILNLYNSLVKGKKDAFKPAGFESKYFPSDTKLIAEPRTNALIVLGSKDVIKRIEDFVTQIDKTVEPKDIIHTYSLQYAAAETIAAIMNAAVQFGKDSDAAKFGGVRNGEKYLSNMYFEAERQGNRLIVRGSPEDYAIAKDLIQQLDQEQPQVAIEVLIVLLDLTKTKQISSQIRNKNLETFNFQQSGFGTPQQGIQINPTTGSLIQNLISLATTAQLGSTVFTLGKENVWAIFSILKNTLSTQIVANPFLTTTNKYTASTSVGTIRRVPTSAIVSGTATTNSFNDVEANLSIKITPQINSYGIVNLDIKINFDNFTNSTAVTPNDLAIGDKTTRELSTNANVADNELVALGGLISNTQTLNETRWPILSKIPIIGNLFKNKNSFTDDTHLIVLISPKIIRSINLQNIYTKNKAEVVNKELEGIQDRFNKRDPVRKWFWKDPINKNKNMLNDFVYGEKETEGLELSNEPDKKEKTKTKPVEKKEAIICPTGKKVRNLADCIKDVDQDVNKEPNNA